MRCKGTTFFRYTQAYKQNYLFFAFIYIISKITSRHCGGSAPYIQHLIILFWVASDNYRSFNPNKISSLIYIYFCNSPSSVFLFPNKNVLSLELTLIVVLIDVNCRYKFLPFGQSLYSPALAHITAAWQPSLRQSRLYLTLFTLFFLFMSCQCSMHSFNLKKKYPLN